MIEIKHCRGCRSFEVHSCIFLISSYRDKVEISNCPCMICIVKMICAEKCVARSEFYLRNTIKKLTLRRAVSLRRSILFTNKIRE